jgi:ABC-type bacteriocin/lantibiotic exporter with double-glycine peptidase domain
MLRWPKRRRRVPYIPQMEVTECGAACLAMILYCHGAGVPLAEVRALCGIGRDGVSAARIYKTAVALGLSAAAFKAEPLQLASL